MPKLHKPPGAPADAPFQVLNDAGQVMADEAGNPLLVTNATDTAGLQVILDRISADTTARINGLAATVEAQRTAAVQMAATAFFADNKARIVPAALESLTTAYVMAANDDHANPIQGVSRLETLKKSIQAMPEHALTVRVAGNNELPPGSQVLPNATGETATAKTAAQIKEQTWKLLAATPDGRASLEALPGGKEWLAANAPAGTTLYSDLTAMIAAGVTP